jgi:hypothetical protein
MRTIDVFVLAAVAGVASTGACNWTEFDNLADEAWVRATKKPDDVSSSDYGVAIARVAQGAAAAAGSGGKLAVLSTGAPGYSELVYSASGESSGTATQRLQVQITSVGTKPILLAVPATNEVSAVVPAGTVTAILTGTGNLKDYQIDASPPDAATYLRTTSTVPSMLVAVKGTVFGTRPSEAAPPPPHPRCELRDSTAPTTQLQITALGTVPNAVNDDVDDVLAWAASGKLYRYPQSVFSACAVQNEIAATTIMHNGMPFTPEVGAQILSIDPATPNLVLLQGHSGASGILVVVNASTMTVVGAPIAVSGLRTAAVLAAGTRRYAVAGAPGASVDGTSSGLVTVHEIAATGINSTAVASLHDAQPENTQLFGRAVAVMPFNGKDVLAVAADNEIFVYFRVKMASGELLYDETRQ